MRKIRLLTWIFLVRVFVCVCSVTSSSLWPPWTGAHHASLSVEFSRQEFWRGLSSTPEGICLGEVTKMKFLSQSWKRAFCFLDDIVRFWEGFAIPPPEPWDVPSSLGRQSPAWIIDPLRWESGFQGSASGRCARSAVPRVLLLLPAV